MFYRYYLVNATAIVNSVRYLVDNWLSICETEFQESVTNETNKSERTRFVNLIHAKPFLIGPYHFVIRDVLPVSFT